jgi:signal transduction histidine kinase
MNDDLIAGIVRILKSNGSTAGTGFIVSQDGLVATCSHVVQDLEEQRRGDPKPEEVGIVFRASGEKAKARVIPDYWLSYDDGDVSILESKVPFPAGSVSLPLGSSSAVAGHSFWSFGFPSTNPIDGIWGKGQVLNKTNVIIGPKKFSVLQLSSAEITPGFSGAPIWDEKRRRVIGMAASMARPDAFKRLAETAFILPSETIKKICKKLQLSDICPYKGLDAFTEVDNDFFFGRQEIVRKLINNLRQEFRFLAMLGPSGSGKSSVIQAGLIPKLKKGAIPGSDHWGIILTRPADNPFEQLAGQGLVGTFRDLIGSVNEWLIQNPKRKRLLLVLDQFEELLVSCPEPLRQKFVTQLNALLESPLPITVILGMRDDFYSHFAQHAPLLLGWLERNLANIPPILKREELTAIVKEPVTFVGWEFETGLVDTIVDDALETTLMEGGERVGRSTTLPLLEFSLTQLWEHRADGRLTYDGYRAIGGVTGGLAQWADRAFYSLDKEQQSLTRRILTGLVHMGDESQGIPDSRRRRPLADFYGGKKERRVINALVHRLAAPEARLLVTSRDMYSGKETIEIIHDALLREWRLFSQWLEDDRRFLTWHQELERRVQAWTETAPEDPTQRDNDLLLPSRNLTEASWYMQEKTTYLSQEERNYIDASLRQRQEDERQRQIAREREIMVHVLGLLQDISQALLTTVKEESLLEIIVQGLILDKGFGFDQAIILMLDETTKSLVGAKGAQHSPQFDELPLAKALILPPAKEIKVSNWQIPLDSGGVLEEAVLQMHPSHIHLNPREIESLASLSNDKGLLDYFVIPLVVKDRVTGAIMVHNEGSSNQLNAESLHALQMLATQAAMALENAHLYSTIENNNRELLLIRERMLESDRLAALSSLASGMAHEIRNPLVNIGGFSRRIAKLVEANSPLRGYVEVIQEEVARLEKLLREILDFTGENLSYFGDHELARLIEDTLILAQRDLDAHKIKVVKEFAQLPKLHCDDRQIKQVFYNLYQNAIQAMPNGGTLNIRTFPVERPDGLYAAAAVADTGAGIPMEVLHNIFNPFYSTKDYGTGLGLAIAHRIVSRHFGQIEVNNEIGKGVTIIVSLPVAKYCLLKDVAQGVVPTKEGRQ